MDGVYMIFNKKKEIKSNNSKNRIGLNEKINDFISWTEDNIFNDLHPSIKEDKINKLKKLIEKMAYWYELKFPEYLIDSVVDADAVTNLNYIFSDKNTQLFDASTKTFFNSLTEEELSFFRKPKHTKNIYTSAGQLQLTNDGKVIDSKNFQHKIKDNQGKEQIIDLSEAFINSTINDVIDIATKLNFDLGEYGYAQIKNSIDNYNKLNKFRAELLNAVMYKIIDNKNYNNQVYYGPIRAFLFAKEFDRDINLPIKYSYCYSSKYIDKKYYTKFIRLFARSGGDLNQNCYVYYFNDECTDYFEYKDLETLQIPLKEILKD